MKYLPLLLALVVCGGCRQTTPSPAQVASSKDDGTFILSMSERTPNAAPAPYAEEVGIAVPAGPVAPPLYQQPAYEPSACPGGVCQPGFRSPLIRRLFRR